MGKAKGKSRQDKFYHLAKEQGYRSRASFKLLQLDARYRFLSSARAVLDLCAAPGGWLQVAGRHAPVGSLMLGVDLVPIRPIRGALSLTEDITTPKCRVAVRRVLDSHGCAAFDVVLHDGSPNVGGAWAQEATAQSALVLEAVKLATEFLAPKGTFITKVFRSQDYSAIIYCLKQLFEKVEATKPVASRSTSAEIYVICLKYKAPAKIDPKLLDLKHLFQGAVDKPKVVDVLGDRKQKRNREGYEDGNTTLWKVGLASDFVWSEVPLEFLGTVNAISFDGPACIPINDHQLTTSEIKSLCEDLYVLDKNSFKHLLKWRLRIRQALSSAQVIPKVSSDSHDAGAKVEVDEEEQLINEMEELNNIIDRKKKRAKKQQAKRTAKDKARKAMGMQVGATLDDYHDADLFSLSSIKGKKELVAIESTELNAEDANSSDDDVVPANGNLSEEMDSEEEQKEYDNQLEEMLEEAYDRYLSRRGVSQEKKRVKIVHADADKDLLMETEEGDATISMEVDSDRDQDAEANPLVAELDERVKPSKEQLMETWFSQDVFAEVTESVSEASDSEDEREDKPVRLLQKASKVGTQLNAQKASKGKTREPEQTSSKPSLPSDELESYDDTKMEKKKKLRKEHQDDIEMVPEKPMLSRDDSSSSSDDSSSDESEDYNVDRKAEILAYANRMLRKKEREQILDDGYNRYMFDDEGLPKWFVDDEKRHSQPMKPVTREEIAAMKAKFKEIDTRPSKKVAEAKARKKRAAMKKLEKARKKADNIADQTEISEHSKRKMIDQLYRKAMPKKPQKEYVVAKKGVRVKLGKGKVLVDPRMKKDKRTHGMNKKGKGGSKKGKGTKVKGKKGGRSGGGLKGKKPAAGASGRKVGKGRRKAGSARD